MLQKKYFQTFAWADDDISNNTANCKQNKKKKHVYKPHYFTQRNHFLCNMFKQHLISIDMLPYSQYHTTLTFFSIIIILFSFFFFNNFCVFYL